MRKGFTLIEIMIVVAIIALLVTIAIPNILRARVNSNETNAQATLKTISTACESYAAVNEGNYPESIDVLTTSEDPRYLNEDYTDGAIRHGYTFVCPSMAAASGYTCNAIRASSISGNRAFSICTGGIMEEADGGSAPDCP